MYFQRNYYSCGYAGDSINIFVLSVIRSMGCNMTKYLPSYLFKLFKSSEEPYIVKEKEEGHKELKQKDGCINCFQTKERFDFRKQSSFKAMLLRTPRESASSAGVRSQPQKIGFLGQIYDEPQNLQKFK